MQNRSWGGRFSASSAQAMLTLSASVDVDCELAQDDIRGSLAHARGLQRAGVLSSEELDAIERGLATIADEIRDGRLVWDPALEDVHMNIEARLTALCGPVGGKLHTGRSRNDQVATDLHLYARRAATDVVDAIVRLSAAILTQAAQHVDTLLPGYTHLQRAQPVRLAHHLLAWFEMLQRDIGRLVDARRRMNELPLGAGALAGTTFPIDRYAVARELEFDRPMANSMDAVGSRDFLTELLAALSMTSVHLSRFGEEIVIWSTQEFGFVELDDAFSTGSSMMPQKKNPDVAELVRGRSARVIGSLMTLLTLEKGLPLTYSRDLQEDKVPLFDAVRTVLVSFDAFTGAIATARFRPQAMRRALDAGYVTATEVADYLAARGVPFRHAHEITGRLVKLAMERGVTLQQIPLADMCTFSDQFTADIFEVLKPEVAVERRVTFGGPSKVGVLAALDDARARLSLCRTGSTREQ